MKRSLDRENIVRDASFFSGSTYVSQAMLFIRGFLNAKILGPELYGVWSALNIILAYGAYAHLGSLSAMNREIPYQNGKRSGEGMNKVRNVTFTVCLVTNFIFSSALIVTALFLWNRVQLNEAVGFMAIAMLSFTFSIYEFYRTSLIAEKKFLLISKANVAFSVLSVVITLMLVPALKIYGVYIVAVTIPLSALLYLWFREPYRLRTDFDLKETWRLMKIGLPLMSIDFLDNVTMSIAGMMTLFFLGKVNMGYYAVGMLAARLLAYFPNSISRTFEPHIYHRYGETHDISALKKYLFKPALVMAFLFPVITVFYYTGAAFFIKHFLPKYSASVYPFFIILIARFFMSFSPTASVFLTALNKQRFIVPVYLGGIAIAATAGPVFINMGFGISGVAAALLLSFFFTGSVIAVYAAGHYIKSKFRCLAYLVGLFVPFIYMAAALVFAEALISNLPGLFSDTLRLAIKLMILSIFSAPLVYLANKKTGIVADVFGFLKSGGLRKI